MITFNLFAPLILNCLVIFGVYAVTREGMVGEKIGDFIRAKVGEYWAKPLADCPPCMGSFHGIYFYLIFVNNGWLLLPFYLVALCGLNYLVVKITFNERD